MAQNYLIFSDSRKIVIYENADEKGISVEADGKILELKRSVEVQSFVRGIESGKYQELSIKCTDADEMFEVVKSAYDKLVLAAGGVVENSFGQVLMIFRNGKWDLPKGKLEEGESALEGALREVKEETGLKQLAHISSIGSTYHTYHQKGKSYFKETIWYLMSTNDKNVKPQLEEGITQVQWFDKHELPGIFGDTYHNIELLIKRYLSKIDGHIL